jgi:N-acetylglucosaminyldiphosphoundecaprenol N-acetyl-beta-D-mannosaminyltransferase
MSAAPSLELPDEPLAPPVTERVPFGRIHVDVVSFDGAVDAIIALCRAGRGGTVLTPNVDHVVMAETDDALKAAYDGAALSLADGKPLIWLAKSMGRPLPAKVSGSDLLRPLVARATKEGLSCFFFGGKEGIAQSAADLLAKENPGLKVAGCYSPPFGFEKDPQKDAEVVELVRKARPDIVFVALGAPKQELWMHKHQEALAPAVTLGIGASLDFIAGVVKRAPPWMSNMGLEWLYRLGQEPRRMFDRYIVRDSAFAGIALRTYRQHKR